MDYNLELEKKISYLEGQLEEKTKTLELLKELYLKKGLTEDHLNPYVPAIPYGTPAYPWGKFPTTSPYTVISSKLGAMDIANVKMNDTNCSSYWLEGVSKATV